MVFDMYAAIDEVLVGPASRIDRISSSIYVLAFLGLIIQVLLQYVGLF
jgi:hypothetical protein